MNIADAIQKITVGLINLIGILILAGTTYWISYLIYGIFNRELVRPRENWYLFLTMSALPLMVTCIAQTLVLSLLTRRRWISYLQGRMGVWLFAAIALLFALFFFWSYLLSNITLGLLFVALALSSLLIALRCLKFS
ncbi:MAG: hypothetical protein WA919_02830 [Coleofasciculaceae cyanobacterium]